MKSHARAASAGPTRRQVAGLGRIFRWDSATRGDSTGLPGSGAPISRRVRLLAVALGLAMALLCLFSPLASASAVNFEFVRSFGPDGTEATTFAKAGPVAVDSSAEVAYVLDLQAKALFKFDLHGNPVPFGGSSPNISGNELSGLEVGEQYAQQIAVSPTNHTIYVPGGYDPIEERAHSLQAFHPDGEPALFSAGTGAGTNEIAGFGNIHGLTVDQNGDIYVSAAPGFEGTLNIYSETGAHLVDVENIASAMTNLSVGASGDLYVQVNYSELTRYEPSVYPVTGATQYSNSFLITRNLRASTVDPTTERVFALEGEYGHVPQVSVFNRSGEKEATFAGPGEPGELNNPYGIAVVNSEEPGIEGEIARPFVTENPEGGPGRAEIFEEEVFIGAPTIEASSAFHVTADTAQLRAKVNPNARATTYQFEYGTEDCSLGGCTVVVPADPELGPGRKGTWGHVQLLGLQAGTTYHYRVVAVNEKGTTNGADKTFTTQVSGLGFQLPDSRAWEMVSPPNKHGGSLSMPRFEAIIQAAANGDGLAYASLGVITASAEGNRLVEESQVLARREGGTWSSEDITPRHTEGSGIITAAEYQRFTPDLSQALVKSNDNSLLSPQSDEPSPYLRTNTGSPFYTALLSNKEGFANIPSGEKVGNAVFALEGSTADLDSVVLSTGKVPLFAGAPEQSLYLWHAGQVVPVSVKPSEEGGEWAGHPLLGSGSGSVRHAISEDGSRAFWGAEGEYSYGSSTLKALYMRNVASEETIRLDVPEAGVTGGEDYPTFQAANADGTVVYFTDSRRLTADASGEGRDLYRCEIQAGPTPTGCDSLIDLSAPSPGSGEDAAMDMRIAPAVSDNGSRAYFVAKDVLDSSPNSQGESAAAGEMNLYLYEHGSGVRFIAVLSPKDSADWGAPDAVHGFSGQLTAGGSPDGRYFVFMSERSLTGYSNEDAASNRPDQEVFRYDAADGELSCLSCNPSGGSPDGQQIEPGMFIDRKGSLKGLWAAATLPEPGGLVGGTEAMVTTPRYVLGNGRVFFNAIDPLVPADSNGNWDVYEYEPLGVGGCNASTGGASAARAAGGCVSLVSSGSGEEEASFLDASESGDDAFFLTTAKLVEIDPDTAYDVYDARVGGIPQKLPTRSECLGEACQAAPSPPSDATPASAAFEGAGNVVPSPRRCPKGKHRAKRGGSSRCVARKHRKKHRAPRRAATRKGAGR